MMNSSSALPHGLISASQLVEDSLDLISLPAVYTRLREVMDDEESNMQDVADVVSLDPALAARLLRIANSAYYGLPSQVETINRAVNMLGTQQIHDLALATCIAQVFDGLPNDVMDMSTFWYRSVMCGYLSKELGKVSGQRKIESLFVRGLLLDIGHLILYSRYPEECRQALADSADDLIKLYEHEQSLIGCDAMSVSMELMKTWKLPQSFVDSYAHLQQPEEAEGMAAEVAILHIAAWITHGLNTDLLLEEVCQRVSPEAWSLSRLDHAQVAEVTEVVSAEMIDAMYRIFATGDAAA